MNRPTESASPSVQFEYVIDRTDHRSGLLSLPVKGITDQARDRRVAQPTRKKRVDRDLVGRIQGNT